MGTSEILGLFEACEACEDKEQGGRYIAKRQAIATSLQIIALLYRSRLRTGHWIMVEATRTG